MAPAGARRAEVSPCFGPRLFHSEAAGLNLEPRPSLSHPPLQRQLALDPLSQFPHVRVIRLYEFPWYRPEPVGRRLPPWYVPRLFHAEAAGLKSRAKAGPVPAASQRPQALYLTIPVTSPTNRKMRLKTGSRSAGSMPLLEGNSLASLKEYNLQKKKSIILFVYEKVYFSLHYPHIRVIRLYKFS